MTEIFDCNFYPILSYLKCKAESAVIVSAMQLCRELEFSSRAFMISYNHQTLLTRLSMSTNAMSSSCSYECSLLPLLSSSIHFLGNKRDLQLFDIAHQLDQIDRVAASIKQYAEQNGNLAKELEAANNSALNELILQKKKVSAMEMQIYDRIQMILLMSTSKMNAESLKKMKMDIAVHCNAQLENNSDFLSGIAHNYDDNDNSTYLTIDNNNNNNNNNDSNKNNSSNRNNSATTTATSNNNNNPTEADNKHLNITVMSTPSVLNTSDNILLYQKSPIYLDVSSNLKKKFDPSDSTITSSSGKDSKRSPSGSQYSSYVNIDINDIVYSDENDQTCHVLAINSSQDQGNANINRDISSTMIDVDTGGIIAKRLKTTPSSSQGVDTDTSNIEAPACVSRTQSESLSQV